MRRLIFACTFVSLPLAGVLARQVGGSAGRASPQGVEVDALNRSVDACTDFYEFACGGWTAKNPVPADRRSWGRFQEVQDRNFTILRRILETPGGDPSTGSGSGDRRKAADYSSYAVDSETHVNGRLTLGENTADNGGIRLALMAYLAGPGVKASATLDGFTREQRVFVGWAQVWCESARPEAERLKALTNPHSSNRYRVNGPLSNMPEFQKAFSCKADAPMVRANACRVW